MTTEVKELTSVNATIDAVVAETAVNQKGESYPFLTVMVTNVDSGGSNKLSASNTMADELKALKGKTVEIQISKNGTDKQGNDKFKLMGVGTKEEVEKKMAESSKRQWSGKGGYKKSPEENRLILLQNCSGHAVRALMHNTEDTVTPSMIASFAIELADLLTTDSKKAAGASVEGKTMTTQESEPPTQEVAAKAGKKQPF